VERKVTGGFPQQELFRTRASITVLITLRRDEGITAERDEYDAKADTYGFADPEFK
jgi:hypothetical protein